MLKKVLLFVAVSLLVGCAQTKFHIQERDDSATAKYDAPQHYFINGIGQQKNLDPVAICGGIDKVKRVETQITFLNGLIGSITFGIYTPFQARVYCSE